MSAVEHYYTVQQLAFLLQFDRKTILVWVRDGRFGSGCLNVDGKDVRVPASGVNEFARNQRIDAPGRLEDVDLEPIAARTAGELKRKAAAVA